MSVPQIVPGKTKLGWIGTGVMGKSMVGHLMDKGFSATVYNRSKDKAEPLIAKGAKWADTPKQVAEQSDVVFTIVGFPADVRNVILGPDGALAGSKAGNFIVDMTTSEPSLAVEIVEACKKKGVYAVDAPVSGGDLGAREARLSIMIGGDKEVVDALQPCWEAMGKTIVRQGGPGAAGSWSLANYGPRIIANNFDPGFAVEHFIKDMGIALDEAKKMNLCLPGLALAHQLYISLKAQGHGRDGTQSLQLALARLANFDWKTRDAAK